MKVLSVKTLTMAFSVTAAVFAITAGAPGLAHAIESGEPFACAAVYACDEEGNVREEFRDGPCGVRYAEQCSKESSEQLGQCIGANTTMHKKMSSLEKRLKLAQRKLRTKSR